MKKEIVITPNYTTHSKVIWLASNSRRSDNVKPYTIGRVKAVYSSGLLIIWDIKGEEYPDLVSFKDIGYQGMYLPLYEDFIESQRRLAVFQKTTLPLLLASFLV